VLHGPNRKVQRIQSTLNRAIEFEPHRTTSVPKYAPLVWVLRRFGVSLTRTRGAWILQLGAHMAEFWNSCV